MTNGRLFCYECKRDFPWLYIAQHRSGIKPPIVNLCYYCMYLVGLTPTEKLKVTNSSGGGDHHDNSYQVSTW